MLLSKATKMERNSHCSQGVRRYTGLRSKLAGTEQVTPFHCSMLQLSLLPNTEDSNVL